MEAQCSKSKCSRKKKVEAGLPFMIDPAGKPWSPVFSFGASRPLHEQGNALAYRAPNAQSIKWKSPDLSKTDPASSPSSATAV